MKRKLALVLVAVGMFSAIPAFAAHQEMTMDHQMMTDHEGARQCALQAESIQENFGRPLQQTQQIFCKNSNTWKIVYGK